MALTGFMPTKWSTLLLYNYNRKHVFADLLNRNYEGDAQLGGNVKILSIGRVTAKAYTLNAGAGGTDASPTITAIERPELLVPAAQFLAIDQRYYFNFTAGDDIEKVQMNVQLMSDAMKEAAYALANQVDTNVNSVLQTGVSGTADGNGNRLEARTISTGAGADDAFETLIDLVTLLREADVYDEAWVVVPPWYAGMLLKDQRFSKSDVTNRANGRIGTVGDAGFDIDIRVSNNLSGATSGTIAAKGGVYTILAGVKQAATFADNINKIEAFRPDDGFMDAVKGLHAWGSKVTRPYALASCAVTAAA
mgnify:CR=1 FL=1